MCGVVGVATDSAADLQHLELATECLRHRGPDDGGVEWQPMARGFVGLGSRRLAILDLSSEGHMPMPSDDRSVWLDYNGEIYNFPELRVELERAGERFRSTGDTEVLLRLYLRHGQAFLDRLNGIFGLILWDRRDQTLLLARDRFGVKPLYYTVQGHRFVAASEVKAILRFPWVPRVPDDRALLESLRFLGCSGERSGFQGIKRVLPGEVLVWRDGILERRRYWQPRAGEPLRLREGEAVHQFRQILDRAVSRQMISDVPIGVFLSGGLDSSAIVALMASRTNSVNTFTIRYRQQDQRWERGQSEAPFAKLVADAFGTTHSEIVVDPEVVSLLPRLVWHLDEPVGDPACVSSYLICSSVPKDLKVLLAGQGADEILAGYHFYQAHQYARYLRALPRPLAGPPAAAAVALLSGLSSMAPVGWKGRLLAAQRFGAGIVSTAWQPLVDRHLSYQSYWTDSELDGLLSGDLKERLAEPTDQYYRQVFARTESAPELDRCLLADLQTHLPHLILNYTDKMGMAASKELRVPFLDNDLVDFSFRLPGDMKLRGQVGKHILRKAVGPFLPREILERRKMPFGVPIRSWLTVELRPMVAEVLSEKAVRQRGYFRPEAVSAEIALSSKGVGKSAHKIWALLMLELWHRVFIDGSLRAIGNA